MKKNVALAVLFALLLANLLARDEDTWGREVDKFSAILGLIDKTYYRSAEPEKLVYSSIRGLLDTLDPHSYFLDPDSFSRMREEYTGKYYGLGIQIQKQDDNLVVVSPIEGTPAHRLGIQPGDVISTINGESTKPLSSFEAMHKLRGPKGTKVTITIAREGLAAPLELTIEREEIPLRSVPYGFLLNSETGYIFIRNFAETTTQEFQERMKALKAQGLKSLILDLRGNTGGTFFQSVDLSDEFLPSGSVIVSIKGRNRIYNREYRADDDDEYEDVPLVILINRGSASASEIVAGAVMDNDRGYVVGEDSWGKGLVQTVFPLGDNLAVALTTARYYTPSGRSIQRDYEHIEDYLLHKQAPDDQREVRYTVNGRKVLGQGGISPDFEIPQTLSVQTTELMIKGAFFGYARRFVAHQTPLSKSFVFPKEAGADGPAAPGRTVMTRDFVAGDAVIADFEDHLRTNKIVVEPDKFAAARDEIRRELQRSLFSLLWGVDEGVKAFSKMDPAVLKALEIMPEAAKFVKKAQPS